MKLIALLLILLSLGAVAAEPLKLESGPGQVALVELFTSEGCSSCPPADQFVSSLKADPDLWVKFVPVAFHVDYWDYLGWRDPFANPDHSHRQRLHKQQGNVNAVYTPGFVVDGLEWRGFFKRQPLPGVNATSPGNLTLIHDDNGIQLHFPGKGPWRAHVALLTTNVVSDVTSGENRSRTLNHDFVVLGHVSKRSGKGEWTFPPLVHKKATAIAAWVTTTDSIQPVQAVGGWLSPAGQTVTRTFDSP